MTTVAELRDLAMTEWVNAPPDQWWKRTAAEKLLVGDVQIILGRRSTDVYLLRCWLSKPLKVSGGPDDGARYESGESLLLHHFLQPDDDGALHDHPWDFVTECLAGGYVETRPIKTHQRDEAEPGPTAVIDRGLLPGQTALRRCYDLHAVARLMPDTWTLLRTGKRVRDWFFHPPGELRVPWRDYLARLGKDVLPSRTTEAAAS